MSLMRMISGLCRDCLNAPECTFPRDPNRPVWQCEEFTGIECGPEKISCEGPLPRGKAPILEGKETGEWIGLCKNCDHRKACAFPKPEGGVWHCDEYK